jgi:Protein of unknown function (DUF3054)
MESAYEQLRGWMALGVLMVTLMYLVLAGSNLREMGKGTRRVSQIVTLGQGWGLLAFAVVADLCAVAIFVLVGRASHHETLSFTGFLTTAWPFIVGVAGGYVGAVLTRWPPAGLTGGAIVLGKTLLIGLVLRYGVQGDGTPLPFIVVTVLVLTALMLGWRLAARIPFRRTGPPINNALPSG